MWWSRRAAQFELGLVCHSLPLAFGSPELPSLAKTLKQGSTNVYKAAVLLSLSPISHHNLCHTNHHTNPSIIIMVTKSGGLETIFFAEAVLFDMVRAFSHLHSIPTLTPPLLSRTAR